jgi:hypothetical protein
MIKDYIAKAFKLAKQERDKHESEISEAYLYTRPNRDLFRQDANTTDRTRIFDSTAPDGVQNLVSTILNLLIPQNSQWATLSVREDLKERVATDVKKALDVANRTVFKTIRDSNFYVAASEALTDAVISGVGCLGMYEETNQIDFIAIPSYQLYFLDNHNGTIETVFREHELPGHFLIENYRDKMGDQLVDACVKEPYKTHKVLESCLRLPMDKEFTYTIQVSKGQEILMTKKMPVQMFTPFRFGKTVGSVYGESPVRMALPHIRVVNEAQMLFMEAASYLALGSWQVNSDTAVNFSNMKLRPGDVITVDSPLQAVPFPGQLNVTEATINDHRQQIRRMLFNDSILPPDESKYQTATEVQIRQAEFYRRLGPYGLRLEKEFLRPIISNLIKRLQMRGEVQDFTQYGPISEIIVNSAVKKGIALTEISRDLQLVQTLNQLGPNALVNVDLQALARKILRDGDMSPEVIKSEDEVAEELQQQSQQQQAQALQDLAQQLQQNPTPPQV